MPALRHAGIAYTQWSKNWVFAPTHCPDKPEIWHGRAPRAKYHICRGRNVGIQPPKLLKFGILSINLLPRDELFAQFFTKFSAFVRVYR